MSEEKSEKANSKRVIGLGRQNEETFFNGKFSGVIGVDEAGRGPLAGPVVAAACFIPLGIDVAGIHDSKKLSEEERDRIHDKLMTCKEVIYAVEQRDPEYIDTHNILASTLDAMASATLAVRSEMKRRNVITQHASLLKVCIDGNRMPPLLKDKTDDGLDCETYVKGDGRFLSIAAASVIAKVTRDRLMESIAEKYPLYDFHQHKGYPTPAHQACIKEHGPSYIHRLSFQPIKRWLLSGDVELPPGRTLPPPPPPKTRKTKTPIDKPPPNVKTLEGFFGKMPNATVQQTTKPCATLDAFFRKKRTLVVREDLKKVDDVHDADDVRSSKRRKRVPKIVP